MRCDFVKILNVDKNNVNEDKKLTITKSLIEFGSNICKQVTINMIYLWINMKPQKKPNYFQAAPKVKLCISVEACLKGQEKNSWWRMRVQCRFNVVCITTVLCTDFWQLSCNNHHLSSKRKTICPPLPPKNKWHYSPLDETRMPKKNIIIGKLFDTESI